MRPVLDHPTTTQQRGVVERQLNRIGADRVAHFLPVTRVGDLHELIANRRRKKSHVGIGNVDLGPRRGLQVP